LPLFGLAIAAFLLYLYLPAYELCLANRVGTTKCLSRAAIWEIVQTIHFLLFLGATLAGSAGGLILILGFRPRFVSYAKDRKDAADFFAEAADELELDDENVAAGIYRREEEKQRAAADDERVRANLFVLGGILCVFVATYVGAIFLAGGRQLPLPHVVLLQQTERSDPSTALSVKVLKQRWIESKGIVSIENVTVVEGTLLSHTDKYWHLLSRDGHSIEIIPERDRELALIPVRFSCKDFASPEEINKFLKHEPRYAYQLDSDRDEKECEGHKFNEAPEADAEAVDTSEDAPKVIDVLLGDTDDGKQPLRVTSVEFTPNHGTADILHGSSAGKIRYAPEKNITGDDHFTYEVCDKGEPEEKCTTAQVTITVHPDNDKPSASNDHYTILEDVPLTVSAKRNVLSNDEDIDNGSLTASVVRKPENGALNLKENGTFAYDPDTDFYGEDFFTYKVSDPKGATATATTTITVEPDNDKPTSEAGGPYFVNEGSSVVLSASGDDPEGETLTYRWDLDSDGFFETSGRNATFSAWNIVGPVTYGIDVRVTDPNGASSIDDSSVSVEALPPPPVPPADPKC
jgi:hypothetical protein